MEPSCLLEALGELSSFTALLINPKEWAVSLHSVVETLYEELHGGPCFPFCLARHGTGGGASAFKEIIIRHSFFFFF